MEKREKTKMSKELLEKIKGITKKDVIAAVGIVTLALGTAVTVDYGFKVFDHYFPESSRKTDYSCYKGHAPDWLYREALKDD